MQPDIVWKNASGTDRILARRYNDKSVELSSQTLDEDGFTDEQDFNVADVEQAVALVTYLQDFIKSRPVCVSHATEWNVFDGVLWVGGIPTIVLDSTQNTPEWTALLSLMLTGNVTRSLFENYATQPSDTVVESYIIELIEQYKGCNEF
jgi:hypothetical protein